MAWAISWSASWWKRGWSASWATSTNLRAENLAELERMGEKSARNVIDSIKRSRQTSLERLINGLGIRHVGEHTARQLAQYFRSIQRLEEATEDELLAVRDIGPEVARSIREYFEEPHNSRALASLLKNAKFEFEPMPAARRARPVSRQDRGADRRAQEMEPFRGGAEDPGGGRDGFPLRSAARPIMWWPVRTRARSCARHRSLGSRLSTKTNSRGCWMELDDDCR